MADLVSTRRDARACPVQPYTATASQRQAASRQAASRRSWPWLLTATLLALLAPACASDPVDPGADVVDDTGDATDTDTDADTGEPLTCADLTCGDIDRTCDEGEGGQDATCGACLPGLTEHDGSCISAIDAPTGVAVVDTSTEAITVAWDAVPWDGAGTVAYVVVRDGQVITDAPIAALSFEDTGAPAPGPPEAPAGVTASSDRTDAVVVSWQDAVAPRGAEASYRIRAVVLEDETLVHQSSASDAASGSRDPYPVTGYEVDYPSSWLAAGDALTITLTEVPSGVFDPAPVASASVTRSDGVFLSTTPVVAQPGAAITVRVRALSEAGEGVPSVGVEGRRAAGSVTLTWQRRAGNVWSNLGTGQTALDADVTINADQDYRIRATAPGVTTAFSEATGRRLRAVLSVALGGTRGCLVEAGGAVRCWGVTVPAALAGSVVPTAVSGISDASRVASGSSFHCALRSTGAAACWGSNQFGQLGDDTTDTSETPRPVFGLSDGVELASGDTHTCVRRSAGGVSCWGQNNGRLGNGQLAISSRPVGVTGLGDATRVVAGGASSCAIRSSGELWCWGNNSVGQLGDGSTTQRTAMVRAGTLTGVVSAGISWTHACAVRDDGTLWCWGGNAAGQRGIADTGATDTAPVQVPGVTGVVEVAVGTDTTCYRDASEAVWCLGRGSNGALGDGAGSDSVIPVRVAWDEAIERLTAGPDAFCAVSSGGELRCWGPAQDGRLGTGDRMTIPTPARMAHQHVAEATLHMDASCVVLESGAVACAGSNTSRQLLDGTRLDRALPVTLPGVAGADVVAVGAGFVCVLEAGQVSCAGRNEYGLAGQDPDAVSVVESLSPVTLPGTALDVAAGDEFSCALMANGAVRCWGANYCGMLGSGDGADRHIPSAVVGVSDAVRIAVSEFSACALTGAGDVWCWGCNFNGGVGDGTFEDRESPVLISIGDVESGPVTSIQATTANICATTEDGTLWCWGLNPEHLVDDQQPQDVATPTPMTVVPDAVELHGGWNELCALDADGDVWCWGSNGVGQLGRGTVGGDGTTPERVLLPAPVRSLRGTSDRLIALLDDDSAWFWGWNQRGESATGDHRVRWTPALVLR